MFNGKISPLAKILPSAKTDEVPNNSAPLSIIPSILILFSFLTDVYVWTENTTFIGDLCADSLDVYQIIVGVEEALNISLANEEVESISTIGEAVTLIEKVIGN